MFKHTIDLPHVTCASCWLRLAHHQSTTRQLLFAHGMNDFTEKPCGKWKDTIIDGVWSVCSSPPVGVWFMTLNSIRAHTALRKVKFVNGWRLRMVFVAVFFFCSKRMWKLIDFTYLGFYMPSFKIKFCIRNFGHIKWTLKIIISAMSPK